MLGHAAVPDSRRGDGFELHPRTLPTENVLGPPGGITSLPFSNKCSSCILQGNKLLATMTRSLKLLALQGLWLMMSQQQQCSAFYLPGVNPQSFAEGDE